MLSYVIVCYRMLSYVIVCYRMLSYVIVCYRMLSYVIVCYRMHHAFCKNCKYLAFVAVLFDVYFVYHLEIEDSVQFSTRPTSKFMPALDVVRRYTNKLNFGFFDGAVSYKAPEVEFIFVYCKRFSTKHSGKRRYR